LGRQTQTRERLVRTAAELFWSRGYAQTGVSSIMKHARATSGSFYHFFPTKDDLLLAALDAAGEQLEAEVLDRAESASPDLAGRIAVVIRVYRERTSPTAPGFGFPIGRLVGELGPDHIAARRRVDETLDNLVSRIAGWLAESSGSRLNETSRRRFAEFVVSAIEGAAVVASVRGSTEPFETCATQLALHIGLLVDGAHRRAGEVPPPIASNDLAADWKAW